MLPPAGESLYLYSQTASAISCAVGISPPNSSLALLMILSTGNAFTHRSGQP